MELPKNITQIGETERGYKIYIEDYVISYVKQMNRFAEDKEIALSLYGKCSREENATYYFIYGACKLDFLQKEVRHLSSAQNQEMDKLRNKYFPEYDTIGYLLLNGEMVEGIYIKDQNVCRFVTGYSCFYERNDSMLAYMLDNQSASYVGEEMSLEKYDMVRRRQEERKKEYEEQVAPKTEGNKIRFATVFVFFLLCFLGYATLQNGGFGGIKMSLEKTWDYLAEQKLIVKETINEEDNGNRLVAEDSLTDVILEENEKYVEANQNDASKEELLAQSEEMATDTEVVQTMEVVQNNESKPSVEGMQNVEVAQNVETLQNLESGQNLDIVKNTETESVDEPVKETPKEVVEPTLQVKVNESYTIKRGDTLNSISLKQYGSIKYVKQICDLNKIDDADNIQVGQKILLP